MREYYGNGNIMVMGIGGNNKRVQEQEHKKCVKRVKTLKEGTATAVAAKPAETNNDDARSVDSWNSMTYVNVQEEPIAAEEQAIQGTFAPTPASPLNNIEPKDQERPFNKNTDVLISRAGLPPKDSMTEKWRVHVKTYLEEYKNLRSNKKNKFEHSSNFNTLAIKILVAFQDQHQGVRYFECNNGKYVQIDKEAIYIKIKTALHNAFTTKKRANEEISQKHEESAKKLKAVTAKEDVEKSPKITNVPHLDLGFDPLDLFNPLDPSTFSAHVALEQAIPEQQGADAQAPAPDRAEKAKRKRVDQQVVENITLLPAPILEQIIQSLKDAGLEDKIKRIDMKKIKPYIYSSLLNVMGHNVMGHKSLHYHPKMTKTKLEKELKDIHLDILKKYPTMSVPQISTIFSNKLNLYISEVTFKRWNSDFKSV